MDANQSANAGAMPHVAPAHFPPDHQAFLRHIEDAPFQIGVDRGKWRLLHPITWPQVLIAVSAPSRPASPDEWTFRFDLSGYPHQPPTAGLWDVANQNWLSPGHWPKGNGRFSLAFNSTWNAHALYLPCDRFALISHEGWISAHPHLIWTPDKDITFYLEILYDYFHSLSYQGAGAA